MRRLTRRPLRGRFRTRYLNARSLGYHDDDAIVAVDSKWLYIGMIDVPEFGVRDQRGDFEPLVSEDIFYKPCGAKVPGEFASAERSPNSHCMVRAARRCDGVIGVPRALVLEVTLGEGPTRP